MHIKDRRWNFLTPSLVRGWNEMTAEMQSSSRVEPKEVPPPPPQHLLDSLKPRRRSGSASAGRLIPVCCWEAPGWQGKRTGPPWLAPVILPSHSSATDINNNSTSGFTLLSAVNPFHSRTERAGYRRGLNSPLLSPLIPPAVTLHSFIGRAAATTSPPQQGRLQSAPRLPTIQQFILS